MRRGPGIPHIDAFLRAVAVGGVTGSVDIHTFMRNNGYSTWQFERVLYNLKRLGYIIPWSTHGVYMVNPELFSIEENKVYSPRRPREPHLDLLLLVLSGDRTPHDGFVKLWAGARDPGALYRRTRHELLRYGYIEDRYANRLYYPGPHTIHVLGPAAEFIVPPIRDKVIKTDLIIS